MPARRVLGLPLAGALLSLGLLGPVLPAEAATARPGPGAPTAGDSLFPDIGNGGYDVAHYGIRLSYHRSTKTITASTTIRARATKPLTSYTLDLEGLTVTRVKVNGHNANWSRSGHKLKITPKRALRGSFTTTVDYRGKPTTHVDPDGALDGWIPTSDGATVLSEPVGAMTWFPNNNTPRDKATFDVAVNVPKDLEVAGSGDLTARKRHGKTTTWHWQQRRPMATYLAMISIAQYDVYHSTMRSITGKKLPIWTFVDPKLGTLATQRAALPGIIRFEERRFGPYPQTSVGLVVKDTGVGYSLETQNRPVFDEAPSDLLMVHELAHQWFGDSLTPKDWGDIWLNEGFATYAESLWTAAHGGPSTAAQFTQTMADNPASSDLWKPAPAALTDPADLFSDPVYTRGGLTLEALRQKVGDRAFARILTTWASRHRYGGVRTSQFVALAERVSGQNLGSFFHTWLYVPARPAGY
ncbi:M1 family metallopeptidase [Microlunatus ginsengisoli]|uniref:Aminopeptidase N n=1 Tax=Microlunatus ginsengisoli TaxID=363863 RepID=A0ABP6ZJY5_9ACTN